MISVSKKTLKSCRKETRNDMNTIKQHLKSTFTSYELELIRYLLLCIIYDVSKFLILLIFFSIFHLGKYFCMEILFLTSLRNFFGGLHFKHYTSCFIFSFLFSSVGVLLSHLIVLNDIYQIILLTVIILISSAIKPITSATRPPLSAKQEKINHCCGMIVLFVYLILFLTIQNFPYRNICIWTIILQTIQLIVANLMKGENKL